jgi:hypothetical protein
MMPGMYCKEELLAILCMFAGGVKKEKRTPRMVKRMLSSSCEPQPTSRKTPTGGRMMARIILQISLLARLLAGCYCFGGSSGWLDWERGYGGGWVCMRTWL